MEEEDYCLSVLCNCWILLINIENIYDKEKERDIFLVSNTKKNLLLKYKEEFK